METTKDYKPTKEFPFVLNVKVLMNVTGWTFEEIMDLLAIPEESRPRFKNWIFKAG